MKKTFQQLVPRIPVIPFPHIFWWGRKSQNSDRKRIEQKVVKGTEKAIREYRDTFRILAEYDRS